MKIEIAIDKILQAMIERGCSDETIQQARWSCYTKILNEHKRNNECEVSREVLTNLCEKYRIRYENGEITRKFYRSFVKASHRLCSLSETGIIDFSMVKDAKKYNPNKSHLELIEEIKEDECIIETRKKKADIIFRYFFTFIEQREKADNQIVDSDYIEFIREASKTNPHNMNIVIFTLRLINEYLNKKGITNTTIELKNFTPKPPPKKIISPYTQEEINSIINAIDPEEKNYRRNKAIILLAFNTGLRSVDIRHMVLTDINWIKQEIQVVQKKTGQSIAVPVTGTTLNAIADYILKERKSNTDKHVFLESVVPYGMLKSTAPLDSMLDKYCRKASIEKKRYRSFHSLRRAFGTELAAAEVPVTSISQMLGHKDMSSDKAYLSFNRTQTSLCAADFSEVPITKGIYANCDFNNEINKGVEES